MKYVLLLLLSGCASSITLVDSSQPFKAGVAAAIVCQTKEDCYTAATNMCPNGYVLQTTSEHGVLVKCNRPH